MNKPKFVLHIGGQKAGSSAIQGYLFFNRYALFDAGLVYIDKEFGGNVKNAKSHNHMLDFVLSLPDKDFEDRLERLADNSSKNYFVFSSEGLCSIPLLDQLSEKFSLLDKYFDVKIIFYIRNQVDVLYSGWQQWGIQRNFSFKDWIEKAVLEDRANWNLIYRKWSKHFDKSRFSVRVYSKELFPNEDIVQDFVKVSGVPSVKGKGESSANYTFSDLAVIAVRQVCFEEGYDFSKVISYLKKDPPQLLKLSKDNLVLTDKLRKYIVESYEAENSQIFENFNFSENEVKAFYDVKVGEFRHFLDEDLNSLVSGVRQYLYELGGNCVK